MASTTNLKAVIFDIDGTLVDSVDLHARAWQEAFAHFGHSVDFAAVRSQIGKGGDQLMPVFLSKEEIDNKGEEIEAYRTALFKEKYLPQVRGFPMVPELVQRIRQAGLRVALASSAKSDELDAYKRIARIEGLIDEETSSDDAEKSKPHPDIFEAALQRLGGDIGPANVIVIGDAPYDAEAAGKAGVPTIGVLCGGFPETDLRRAGCIAVYRDPSDLLQHFGEWAKVAVTHPKPVVAWNSLGLAAGGVALIGIGLCCLSWGFRRPQEARLLNK